MKRTATVLHVLVCLVFIMSLCTSIGAGAPAKEKPYDGYTLYSPLNSKMTYLIGMDGKVVHDWKHSAFPGLSVNLLENGNLLRPKKSGNQVFTVGGNGGIIEIMDWNGNIVWEYTYSSDKYCQHHDVRMMPNGNILFIAWERKTKEEAVKAGRNPELLTDGELWPDAIFEIKPTGPKTGKIVWEWHLWDHLIQDYSKSHSNYGKVQDHPELVDLNFDGSKNPKLYGGKDWTHVNSVAYNAELDQIVLSVHTFSEVWIIDHSTTTAEAKGHTGGRYGKGGDLLYRWGNPQAYRAGGPDDQVLWGQHDAEWIGKGLNGEGHLIIFNNGLDRKGDKYSSVVEIKTPVKKDGSYPLEKGKSYGPSKAVWSYQASKASDFYSSHVSGSQRLPNGNTMVSSGTPGVIFEVTRDGEVVWKHSNKVTDVEGKFGLFKAERYSADYPGLRQLKK